MTLIEEGTAEVHINSCRGKGLHLVQQVDETAVEAFPVAEIAADSNVSNFAADFLLEHSSTGGSVSAVVIAAHSDDTQMPKAHNRRRS